MSGWSPLILSLVRSKAFSEEALLPIACFVRQNSDSSGSSALHFASLRRDVRYLQFLLRFTHEVNIINHFHETPLHWAVKAGHVDVVRLLLAYGADVNFKDADDQSPLEWAIEEEQEHLLPILQASSLTHALPSPTRS